MRMPASGQRKRVWQDAAHLLSFFPTVRCSLKVQITSKASHGETLGDMLWNYPPSKTKYNARRGNSPKQSLHRAWHLVGLASVFLCVTIRIRSRRFRLPPRMLKVRKNIILIPTRKSQIK